MPLLDLFTGVEIWAESKQLAAKRSLFEEVGVRPIEIDEFLGAKRLDGSLAEIQINVPEMLGAKQGPDGGEPVHKLYEAYREAPKESPLGQEILRSMLGFYAAARKASDSARKSASDRSNHSEIGPRESMWGRAESEAPSDDNANQLLPGISTKKPPSERRPKRQPAGKEEGTFIYKPLTGGVPDRGVNAYDEPDLFGGDDATTQPGDGNGQSQGPGPAQGNGGQVDAEPVRARSGRGDQRPGGDGYAGAAAAREMGQPGANGKRGKDAGGRPDEPGAGAGRVGGGSAGRVIAVKTGRNYVSGPDDLTYESSRVKKAGHNISAVELIKVNQSAAAAVTGDELPPYKMPLVGRLYGNTRGAAGQSELYYENIRLLNELGNGTQKRVWDLRILRRRVAEAEEPGYKEEVRSIDGQIAEAMARVNNEVARVRKEAAR